VARDGGPKNTWRGRNLKGTREIKTVALGLTDTTLPATFITPFLAATPPPLPPQKKKKKKKKTKSNATCFT